MGFDGRAVVYCEGAFTTTYGKTAHGLVRFTRRYVVDSVIDSGCAGNDAGELLDGRPKGIPIVGSLEEAVVAGKLRVEKRGAVERDRGAGHDAVGQAADVEEDKALKDAVQPSVAAFAGMLR